VTAAQTATGVSPSDLMPVNGSAPSGPLHGTAAQPASPLPVNAGEGGRGPQIASDEYRMVAWVPVVDRHGRTRTVAAATRTAHGWHIPTGWHLFEQTRPFLDKPRLSRRRTWVTAHTRDEAELLLAHVAGRPV